MDLKLLIESCSDLEIWVSGGSQIIMLMSFCMWPTDLNFSYILEDSKLKYLALLHSLTNALYGLLMNLNSLHCFLGS